MSAIERVKLRSRMIEVDLGDPKKPGCINEAINERVTSLAFPTRRLSTFLTRVTERVTSRRRVVH